jgi:hypothetical protein
MKILWIDELKKPEHLQNSAVIIWCIFEALETHQINTLFRYDLGGGTYGLIDRLPPSFCNPDIVLSGFIKLSMEEKKNRVYKLLKNKVYLQKVVKYNPDCLIWFLNNRDLCEDDTITDIITDLCMTEVGQNALVKYLFNQVSFEIQLKIAASMLSYINCLHHITKISLVNFLKNEKNLIDCVKKHSKLIPLTCLEKLVNNSDTLIKMIADGDYQLKECDLDYMWVLVKKTQLKAEKLLITQEHLDHDTVCKLLIEYEKENRNLTRTELDLFIKKNKPLYFTNMYMY